MPFPVQTHPRLLVTVNDLPRLRQWYTPSNPMYAKVLLPALVDAGAVPWLKCTYLYASNPPGFVTVCRSM